MQISNSKKKQRRIIGYSVLGIIIAAALSVIVLYFKGSLTNSTGSSPSQNESNHGPENSPPKDPNNPPIPPPSPAGLLDKKIEPSSSGKIYWGAHIYGSKTLYLPSSPKWYNDVIKQNAAGFGCFMFVHSTDGVEDAKMLFEYAKAVKEVNAFLLVTLEPMDGLGMMTDEVNEKIADLMAQVNDMGVPVLLRFAHEFNGPWYSWGTKPTLFKKHWISLTNAIRKKATLTSMMWSPNSAENYPWAAIAEANRAELDTNGDGQLTSADDPYTPYWPGEEYVDWVGISLFHFGQYPFGNNTLPPSDKVISVLTGTSTTTQSSFTSLISTRYKKPLAIIETASTYYPNGNGSQVSNKEIKMNWVSQIISEQIKRVGVRLVMWFDAIKMEEESGQLRDFALTNDTEVLKGVQQIWDRNKDNLVWL
ncbi:glycoside hydrolase superfamily [Paraphysoderma sedebokerense]|nr:glycoside hydrolase superfamily [Paraphysoderma sedebokerense]